MGGGGRGSANAANQQRLSELLTAARPAETASAANAGPSTERSGNPASRLGLFEKIQQKNQERGGLRTDARGNVRCRCPFCEYVKDKTFVWNPEKNGGAFQCFHCGERGGWRKLAQQYGLLKRYDAERRIDPSIFHEWAAVALTAFDWRRLIKSDQRRPIAIARGARTVARAYVALCELAAAAGTYTPAAATRTVAEVSGLSQHAVTDALWRLRASGLTARTERWQERTRQSKCRKAAVFRIHDLRKIRPDLFLSAPEPCEAGHIPELASGALRNISVAWHRGGIPHSGRVLLAHVEARGSATAKHLQAATGLSQGTVSKALRKLAELNLVLKDGRLWVRTPRTVASVIDGPDFDKARAVAARRRRRHEVERACFDDVQLPGVLASAAKAPTKLVMTPDQHQAGPQTHQEHAGATDAGKGRPPYAPIHKAFSATTRMRM